MGALEIMGLVSKIATDAPVLLPDALKIMTDMTQVLQDFQKLIQDYQQSTGKTVTPAA